MTRQTVTNVLLPRVLLVAAILVASHPVTAADLTVPGDHPTIQDAVNNASPGDVIVIGDASTYTVAVDLDLMGSAVAGPRGDITLRAANPHQALVGGSVTLTGTFFASGFPGDITIRDLQLTHDPDPDSHLDTSRNGLIQLHNIGGIVSIINNQFVSGYGSRGVSLTSDTNSLMTYAFILDNLFVTPSDSADAISIRPGHSTSNTTAFSSPMMDVVIDGNTFTDLQDSAVSVEAENEGTISARITNNIVNNLTASDPAIETAIAHGAYDNGSDPFSAPQNTQGFIYIAGNDITNPMGEGIHPDIDGGSTSTRLIISGNTVRQAGTDGVSIDSDSSVGFANRGHLLLSDNLIMNTGEDGIKLRPFANGGSGTQTWHAVISGNSTTGTSTNGFSTDGGFVIDTDSTQDNFTLNVAFSGNSSSVTAGFASYRFLQANAGIVNLDRGASVTATADVVLANNGNTGTDTTTVTGLVNVMTDAVIDDQIPRLIQGSVFNDVGSDGQSGGDAVVPLVGVSLIGTETASGLTVTLTTYSDPNGLYAFPAVLPGSYTLTATPTAALPYFTAPNIGNDASDSDVNPATGTAGLSVFPAIGQVVDIDIGLTATPWADLAVAVTESVDPVIAGSGPGNLVYSVVVINNGPVAASGLALAVPAPTLPSGASVGSATASTGTFSTGTWTIGGLGIGASATLTVPITVGSSAAVGTDVITQSASVSSLNESDYVPGNDSGSESTSITRSVSLGLSKTESADPVVAGSGASNLTYLVTATNNGPSDASGLVLSEALTLPSGVSIVSITPGPGTTYLPANAPNGTWTVGSLAASNSATLTVVLTAASSTASGTDVISDTVTVTAINETNVGATSVSEATSVNRQVNLALTKTESIDPVVAGSGAGNLVYTITVTNNGPSDASGLQLSEALTLPSGVTISSIAASGSTIYAPANSANGTWVVGSLAVSANATLTVTLTAGSSAATGTDVISDTVSVTAINESNAGASSVTEATSVTRNIDLTISKTESIDPVVAGSGASNLVYTVVVNNLGPSDASGVTVSEDLTLPSGVSRDSVVASSGGFVDTTAPDGTWTFDVNAGASATLTVTVTADPSAASGTDVIADTATVTGANESLINTGDDTVTEATSVTREVDLAISKTESIDPVVAGSGTGNLIYVVTLSNNGPSDATSVTVSEDLTLPTGVSRDSVSATAGSFADTTAPDGTWSLDLPSGSVATLTVTLTADASTAAGTDVIADTAAVTGASEALINTGDDTVTVATSVVRESDLTITKSDDVDPINAAQTLTYTITVSNAGPSDALGVVVSDTLPAGVTFTSTSGCSEDPGGVPTCTLGTVAAGGSAQYTVAVAVDGTTEGTITNNASVAASTTLVNPGDDSTSEDTLVNAIASLTNTLAGSSEPVIAGTALTYTVGIGNIGPGNASTVTAYQVLPDGAAYVSDTGGCSQPGTSTALRGDLQGASVVPPVVTTASGDVTMVLDTTSNQLTFALHLSGLSPAVTVTAAHLHQASAGNNGAVVNFLYDGTSIFNDGNPITGTVQLTSGEASDLLTMDHYVLVHTTANGGGEVRAQLAVAVQTPVQCGLGTIAASGSSSFDVVVQVPANAVDGASLRATTLVQSATDDPNLVLLPAPNGSGELQGATAHLATTVGTEADLVITKSDSVDPVIAGNSLTYTVRVTNNGPSDAQDVVVTDTLPAGVTFVSTNGCAEDPNGVATCSLGTIAASAFAEYTINVVVDSSTLGTITNQASVSSSTAEGNPGDESASEDTTVQTQADLSITKSDDVDPINAAQTLTYTITVSNAGPSDALGVVVSDTLPAGVTFTSTSGCSEDPGGVPTCTLGTVAAGGSAQYTVAVAVDGTTEGTITNNASVAASTTLVNPGDDSTSEDTLVNAIASLTNTLAGSSEPVIAGTALTYTVGIGNIGPGNASTVTAYQVLPDGAAYVSDTGGCSQPGTSTALRGDLQGASVVPPVVTTASGDVTMVLDTTTNQLTFALHLSGLSPAVTVTAAHLHQASAGNNGAVVNFLYDGTPIFDDGNPITGTVQLTSGEASDLLTLDHYVLVHTTANGGGEVRAQLAVAAQTPVLCGLGTIAASGSSSFDVVVQVPANAADGGSLRATTLVQSATDDPNLVLLPTPNGSGELEGATAHLTTTVGTEADLVITKSDSVDPVIAGNSLTYTVRVTNNGPSDAQDVVVTDTLPAGVTVVSTSGCGEDPNGVPTCSLGTVAAGAFAEYTINVVVDSSTLGTITNSATVSSSTNEGNPGDESVDETTFVNSAADLSITKTDSVDPVIAGTQLTYTVNVSNSGPSDALDVVVTDTLPTGVTLVSTSGCVEDPTAAPTCSLGSIAAGAAKLYTITVQVDSSTVGSITNQASVSSSTSEANPGDESTSENTTVDTEADLAITKTDSVDPVLAGTQLGYTITVSNSGPSDALNVVVTDTLPAGVTIVSTSGCASDPNAVPTCDLGTITAGNSAQYTILVDVASSTLGSITNSATVTSSTTEANPGDETTTETTQVNAEADLVITKTDSVDPVVAGTPLTYTITVSNNGPSDALDVVATDVLPAGVTFVSTSGCSEDPSGVPTCSLGTLVTGASKQYTVAVGVDSATLGLITNQVTVTSSTPEGNPGDESASENTTAEAHADLSVTKTDSVDPVVAGTQLVYTVRVDNAGPSDATNVVLTDVLPGSLTLVSTSGCVEDPLGAPSCSLGTVAAGAFADYTITVDVLPDTRGVISNTASVVSSATDSNAANDSDTEDTTVSAEVDLTLVKTDSADPLPSGDALIYTLVVTNNGPSQATGVVVTDTLPAGVTLVSTSGCTEDPTAVPTCSLGIINPGATTQYTITVTINPAPPGSITNSASVTSVEPETNPADNSDDETTILDNIPPQVVVLSSVLDTGDGVVDECESALVTITELVVSYSESMRDPVGDADPDDVSNPLNYLVVAAGPDGDLSTSSCGSVFGDDQALVVNAVLYDDGSHTARVLVNALPSSRVRVMACASLTDLAGNPLDGDGNGSAGDDFVRTFRSDPGSLFLNGHFDCSSLGLSPWTVSDPVEVTYSTDDIISATQSGSAQVAQLAANTSFSINQCVPIGGVAEREISSRLRLSAPGPFTFISYSAGCEFFAGDACGAPGSGLSSSVASDLLTDTGGTWLTMQGVTISPPGASSAQCGFSFGTSSGADFTAWLDSVFLSDGGFIFVDGFGSGDTTAWSHTTP